MSSTKKTDAAELRAELARRNITRREVAEALGLSYNYVKKILSGERNAELRREQIASYIEERSQGNPNWLRGVA